MRRGCTQFAQAALRLIGRQNCVKMDHALAAVVCLGVRRPGRGGILLQTASHAFSSGAPARPALMQLLLDLARPAAPTLDNFEPGDNAEVLSALRGWLSAKALAPSVYLWGPPGSGKSHLLRAAVADAAARGRSAHYLAAGAAEPPEALRAEWLAADDVHALEPDAQASLFTLLNRAAAGELHLLLAGDNAPSGLRMRADVRTRIGAALVLQVKPLSDEDKMQALRRHADARGFELTPECAQYLMRYGRRDLPWLVALLDAADRYSLQTQRGVSVPLLREVLQLAERSA
jgi:DnaA family protein